ncbi:hypothetical protein H310_12707 [Aphanomyces invadans]|uniref:Uncharacterized protein n=1 Tax=Aphanomyces invadans TaxID=157072 RepID=A0A024TGZ2_9STRA|nr:hypothetical protein H310_12707 [Aphanomyces invadans]ETV93279.1 hypothetical protein H310_12707 [Aphanomyces invadans]|eukprot:XP_008878114.1 hypothetical protein H310_12707 [Aphanomyces invadans]
MGRGIVPSDTPLLQVVRPAHEGILGQRVDLLGVFDGDALFMVGLPCAVVVIRAEALDVARRVDSDGGIDAHDAEPGGGRSGAASLLRRCQRNGRDDRRCDRTSASHAKLKSEPASS